MKVDTEDFVRAYERMAADVERVIAEYPPEMREELRAHAREVIDQRMKHLWEERQRRRAMLCEQRSRGGGSVGETPALPRTRMRRFTSRVCASVGLARSERHAIIGGGVP